jgi:DNA-directed RNA polymerase specialized sigma24 family protein
MLMTYTSPELPAAAEGAEPINLPVGCRHLEPDRKSAEERESTFELQFSHCRRLLLFIARRILNSVPEAEEAVKNCHLTASCNPPEFSMEGAFKSWLVRILIDEATLLLRKRQSDPTASSTHLPTGR